MKFLITGSKAKTLLLRQLRGRRLEGMQITRYFQSCLLIELGSTRLLIDPSAQEKDRLAEFGKLDAVLYTHQHNDHFDAEMAENFLASGVSVYANQATAEIMQTKPQVVADKQEFNIKDIALKSIDLPHCLMIDGSSGPQNTGYLINEQLFHPGDGVQLDGLKVANLALPITGPDISLKEAYEFAKKLEAKVVIPIHYDYIGTKPELLIKTSQAASIEVRILELATSTTI